MIRGVGLPASAAAFAMVGWLAQQFDHDAIALAGLIGAAVPGLGVGTSVVPINPRHPLVVASLAQTAQAASHGNFSLGLGLGAHEPERQAFGVTWPNTIRRLREHLTVLRSVFDTVLAVAFALESTSLLQAIRQLRGEASRLDRDVLSHVLETSDPTTRAVFAEDTAALVGILLAVLGIGLHQATRNAAWDAVGSILVGLLLGVVAVLLIDRNRRFLVGEPASPQLRAAAVDRIQQLPESLLGAISAVGVRRAQATVPCRQRRSRR